MGVRRSIQALVVILAVSFLIVTAGIHSFAAVQPGTQQSFTSLTIAPNPAIVGQTVTFTAKVTGGGLGVIPMGMVTFQTASMQIGTATLDNTGTGVFSTSTLAVGTYDVTATYGGDGTYASSTSSPVTLQIVPQGSNNPSITTLKIVPDPAMLDQTITFTSHVGGATGVGGGQIATGTVTFSQGMNQLGIETLDGTGNATLSNYPASNLGLGTYTITASYSGDAYYAASTSQPTRLDIVPVGQLTATTTTISSSNGNADFGTQVTFSARVTAGFGNPPTGTVTFNDSATELGMGTLSNGVATFSTSSLSVGTHIITGVYSGDSQFQGSTSPPFTQTINNTTSIMFILNVSPTTVTVNQGNSGTANVTLTPSGGFNQTVTFLCSGLPIYSQCSFSPSSVTPDGSNTPVHVVMTVSTNVATARLLRPNLRRGGAVLAVFSMGILGLIQVRGRRQKQPGRHSTRLGRYASWLSLLLCIAVVTLLASCGGSGSNNRVLTPKGMSTVTVAGSTPSGAQTTSFTLVVQ